MTKFCFNNYALCMSIVTDFLSHSNIYFIRFCGSINHNRGKSAVDAALAELEAVAVVKVKSNRDIGILDNSCLNQLYQISMIRISASALET